MQIKIEKLGPSLALKGTGSLQSAIQSIEDVGFELITLCGAPPEGGAPTMNIATFKRLGLGAAPAAVQYEESPIPAPNQDAQVDAANAHAAHRLLGSAPVWVQNQLRIVTAWRS